MKKILDDSRKRRRIFESDFGEFALTQSIRFINFFENQPLIDCNAIILNCC